MSSDLTKIQDSLLPAALAAAARSPFYRTRRDGVPANRAELAGYPLTTKADLRDAYPFGMLAVDRSRLATYHESSGTTGTPTASYYTKGDWADLIERYARVRVGIEPADTFMVRTPYALMLTGHVAHAAALARGATVVPADNRSLATPYSKVVKLMHDLEVTLTWSLPTDTLLWAAAASRAGLRGFPALRAMLVAGEPLSPARRDRISEIWKVPVVQEYGSSETGGLAGECPHGRLHLWADRAIFEVYDPSTGRLTPDGAGELVVTMLVREAMPLLRYHIGDRVRVSYGDCPCGSELPVVRVLGRMSQQAAELEEAVFRLPLAYGVMFWRARRSSRGLHVQIEVPDRYRYAAARDLTAAIEKDALVEAVPPGTLVPVAALTAPAEIMKPRSVFAAGEDWDRALRYY
ncbi:phenylacetate--CoA ligase family protein [Paractinoplanes atraurantiacus]|uniref:Phenylacetate-CoA ligase n=1 Tax=Paractinoplanes atraurantiacus TaxID=1036182 RepID=A0A285I167_9ACTN|nr:AMP-binding protein [Actinoplanes atraurantiacus]SNY40796.1 phenylacetate-CoA ligase [Actinoplanes atraurantiacus]